MTAATNEARLEYESVSVDFGATRALTNISFSVRPGEIVGLLGHNGAGKSTLFNVTSGVIAATHGSFSIDGLNVGGNLSPREAAERGITIIHQEPALAPNLSVLENLFLARRVPVGTDRKRQAREALAAVGTDLPLDMPVDALGLGDRQLVDLARGLLSGEMKVLLLDEPTAALGKAETDSLHALIRSFADRGVAVVYVSHRLPDIMEVCTRMVVLRGGELVVDDVASSFTPEKLAKALVPELRQSVFIDAVAGPSILRLETQGGSIEGRRGEVVGLFGMAGGEQFELVARLAGVTGVIDYQLGSEGIRVGSPRQAIRRGVFFVPPDRDTDGLIASESGKDNVMLPWYASSGRHGWWIGKGTGSEVYDQARQALDIHGPSGDAEVSQFSGGNRQKHLLARWLYPAKPELLLLAQPTQGVDVGAKLDIVDAVRNAAKDGACVIVASSESDEIASMCDRSYVLLGEKIAAVDRTENFNSELLASLLTLAEHARTGSGERKP